MYFKLRCFGFLIVFEKKYMKFFKIIEFWNFRDRRLFRYRMEKVLNWEFGIFGQTLFSWVIRISEFIFLNLLFLWQRGMKRVGKERKLILIVFFVGFRYCVKYVIDFIFLMFIVVLYSMYLFIFQRCKILVDSNFQFFFLCYEIFL